MQQPHPIDVPGHCQYEGCSGAATTIASGREPYQGGTRRKPYTVPGHPEPGRYCDAHGSMVSDEDAPEYVTCCPNCGCHFGVN